MSLFWGFFKCSSTRNKTK